MTINLNHLKSLKKNRNNTEESTFERYTSADPDNSSANITVVGNPNLQGLNYNDWGSKSKNKRSLQPLETR